MSWISGVFPLHINVNPNPAGLDLSIPDVDPQHTNTLHIRAGNRFTDTLPLSILASANSGVAGFVDLNTKAINTPSGTITLYCAAPLSSGVSSSITLFAKVIDASGTIVNSIPLYIQQNMFSGLKLRIEGGWTNAVGVSSFQSRDGYTPVDGARILHIERVPGHHASIDMYVSGTGSAGSMDLALINNENYLNLNMSDVSPKETTNLYVSGGWNGNPFVPNMSGGLNMYIDI